MYYRIWILGLVVINGAYAGGEKHLLEPGSEENKTSGQHASSTHMDVQVGCKTSDEELRETSQSMRILVQREERKRSARQESSSSPHSRGAKMSESGGNQRGSPAHRKDLATSIPSLPVTPSDPQYAPKVRSASLRDTSLGEKDVCARYTSFAREGVKNIGRSQGVSSLLDRSLWGSRKAPVEANETSSAQETLISLGQRLSQDVLALQDLARINKESSRGSIQKPKTRTKGLDVSESFLSVCVDNARELGIPPSTDLAKAVDAFQKGKQALGKSSLRITGSPTRYRSEHTEGVSSSRSSSVQSRKSLSPSSRASQEKLPVLVSPNRQDRNTSHSQERNTSPFARTASITPMHFKELLEEEHGGPFLKIPSSNQSERHSLSGHALRRHLTPLSSTSGNRLPVRSAPSQQEGASQEEISISVPLTRIPSKSLDSLVLSPLSEGEETPS